MAPSVLSTAFPRHDMTRHKKSATAQFLLHPNTRGFSITTLANPLALVGSKKRPGGNKEPDSEERLGGPGRDPQDVHQQFLKGLRFLLFVGH